MTSGKDYEAKHNKTISLPPSARKGNILASNVCFVYREHRDYRIIATASLHSHNHEFKSLLNKSKLADSTEDYISRALKPTGCKFHP